LSGAIYSFLLGLQAGLEFSLALRLGLTLQLGTLLRLGFFAGAALFGLNGVLDALTGLLTGLGARCGEVTVLGAMQIRPRIQGRYIFGCFVGVVGRPVVGHNGTFVPTAML
jgi:hypothetical protein